MDYTIFLEPKDKRLGTFVNHFLFEDLAWCAAQRFHRTPRRVPGSPGSDRPEPPGGAFAAWTHRRFWSGRWMQLSLRFAVCDVFFVNIIHIYVLMFFLFFVCMVFGDVVLFAGIQLQASMKSLVQQNHATCPIFSALYPTATEYCIDWVIFCQSHGRFLWTAYPVIDGRGALMQLLLAQGSTTGPGRCLGSLPQEQQSCRSEANMATQYFLILFDISITIKIYKVYIVGYPVIAMTWEEQIWNVKRWVFVEMWQCEYFYCYHISHCNNVIMLIMTLFIGICVLQGFFNNCSSPVQTTVIAQVPFMSILLTTQMTGQETSTAQNTVRRWKQRVDIRYPSVFF